MSTRDNGPGHSDFPPVGDVDQRSTSAPTVWVMASPRRLVISLLVLGAVLVAAGVSTTGVQADEHRQEGTWSPGGRLQDSRGSDETVTRLADGRVLMVGDSSAELWDPDTRSSRLTTPPGTEREEHTATRLDDGRVLVAGGEGPLSSAQVFDPETEEWTTAPSMEYQREEHAAIRLDDGRVLVVGGYGRLAPPDAGEGSVDLTAASAEDLRPGYSRRWNRCCVQDFAFTIAQSGLAAGEQVTVDLDAAEAGGVNYSDDDAHYESSLGEVTSTIGAGTAQLTFTADEDLAAGTRVTVGVTTMGVTTDLGVSDFYEATITRADTGGSTPAIFAVMGSEELATAEIYDPRQDEWVTVDESMNFARRWVPATRLGDGRVMAAGGYGNPAPPAHGEGDDDIARVWAERVRADRSRESQDFAFTIAEDALSADDQVTINLDDAQQGHVDYADDDSEWSSNLGTVTVDVETDTAELAFTAAETVTAGTEVVVESGWDALATDAEKPVWYEAVFTRGDTGGSQTTSFRLGPDPLDVVEIFDPQSETWESVSSMNSARYGFDPKLLDDGTDDAVVLAFGGGGDLPSEFYDPGDSEGSWQQCDSDDAGAPDCPVYPGPRHLEVLADGTLLATGYSSELREWVAQRYDPVDGEWWEADRPEGAGPMALLANGHVFAAEGREAEVYSPETVPAPVVESVSPERGSAEGDFEVTITGQHLTDAIFVSFGDLDFRVTDVMEDSAEQIRVNAPTHPAEWAPVAVATPGGYSERTDAAQLQFVAADGQWTPTGDMAGSRRSPGTAILDGPACDGDSPPDYCDKVLFVSGSSSELYDPDTGQFGDTAALPDEARTPESRTIALDGPACRSDQPPEHCGKVLVNDKFDSDMAALYDPQRNQWDACGADGPFDCPPSVDEHGGSQWEVATLIDGPECHEPGGPAPDHCGRVLMNMMDLGDEPIMWLFDPASGEWTQTTTPDEPREIFPMTLIDAPACDGDNPPAACGNVLITSGMEFEPGRGIRTETAELYDPATEEWRTTAEDPAPGREMSTATTLPDGRVVIAGGYVDPKPSAAAEIFDPVDESWEALPDIPMAREGHGSVLLPDGRVMVAGGAVETPAGESEHRSASAVVFDPDAGEWAYTDSMIHGRLGAGGGSPHSRLALTRLPDERVLIAGGAEDGHAAELYELNPGSVAGNVTDTETGNPIGGAEVTVIDGGEQVGSAITDSNGSYRVSVPFGEYTVTADAEGFQAQSHDGVTVKPGETTMAEFALTPETDDADGGGTGSGGGGTGVDDSDGDDSTDTEEPGNITGTVSDAETDDAVVDAEVTVLDGGTTIVTAGTDEQGTYEITGLDPGEYTLTVEADGYASTSQGVTVESGETVTASFTLDPAAEVGRLEGEVIDAASDDPVVGAEITVLDDGEQVVTAGTDSDGAYWVENLFPGGYTVTVDADGYESTSQTVDVEAGGTATADFSLQPTDEPVGGLQVTQRVAGADRFDTAAQLSAQRFDPGVEVAYVATGLEFADALTGGVAAALDNGPVLLAASDLLPEATATELERLSPQRIVLLGGTAALSKQVESEVAGFTDGEVDRLAGANRFATGAEVARELFPDGADTVYVGTGLNFPDVLAGGPAAAGTPAPMLLTTDETVPEATAAELDRLDPDRLVILGGTAAVGDAVEQELADYGQVDRLAGADRFATAAELATSEFADAAAVDRVYVATGLEFADALAAGAVAGMEDVPVLLVATDLVPDVTAAELVRLDPDEIVVMGGSAAINESVEQELDQVLDG